MARLKPSRAEPYVTLRTAFELFTSSYDHYGADDYERYE
jgi:hypothetical protein